MNHHITIEKTLPLFKTILNDFLEPAIAFDVCTSLIETGWHIGIWSLPNIKPKDTFTFEDPAFAMDIAKDFLGDHGLY